MMGEGRVRLGTIQRIEGGAAKGFGVRVSVSVSVSVGVSVSV